MPDNKPDMRNLGVTGLPVYSGRIYDELLRDLAGDRGRRIYREMAEQDPIIGGTLLGIEMLARQVSWSIKAADDTKEAADVAEFIDEALSDMSPTFGNTLSEILTMLSYGWSWFELLYKQRSGPNPDDDLKNSLYDDGKIGWASWAIRSQETLYWWEYEGETNKFYGQLTAMLQQGEPDFLLHRVPRSKSLHFVTRSRRQNPEGVSILRSAYRAWYMKRNIEVIEGIGVERDLAGLPVLWAPEELFSSGASDDEKALFENLKKIVTSIKRDEQEGIVMPMGYDENGEYKNPKYKLELLSTGGDRQFDTSAIINRWDERIAMSMLADFILMGHQSTGSFALSSTKSNLFSTAMSAFLDIIADEINTRGIPKLVVLNGWPLKLAPSLQHGKIEAADMSKVADYLNQLNAAGMPLFPNKTLQTFLLEYAGLPGANEIPDVAEGEIDPITGELIVTDPNAVPAPGAPTSGPPNNPATSPKNKSDKGARPQAPRDIAIRRETARTPKKVATDPDEPESKPFSTHRQKHFVPLAQRVTKLAGKLQASLKPEEYSELLDDVMAQGRFRLLTPQHQEWILAIEKGI